MNGARGRVALLAALTGLMTLAACIGLLAVAGLEMVHDGVMSAPLWQVLACGAPAALVVAAVSAGLAAAMAHKVATLRAEQRRLDALQLRVRMADEVAERHRRLAETAGAGMFELLSGLVAAEEGARGQLSAELHDTVAQSLANVRVLLCDGVPEAVKRATDLVVEAEEQVRSVMARTRPPALREGDLARAVSGLRDDLQARYALDVELSWPLVPYPLPLVTAVTVYRFFQEALLNVVKHADVDHARASLWVDEDWVVAEVADHGPGFDPSADHAVGGRHVGLDLLKERARLVGGSVDVVSRLGKGTTLTLRLPRGGGGTASLLPAMRSTTTNGNSAVPQPVSEPAG